MHAAAVKGFTSNLEALPREFREGNLRVLDMGGADVNGTVHAILDHRGVELDVLDIAPGEGVTIVGDARETDWWYRGELHLYDLVISTEMLEHLEGWPEAISTAFEVLQPRGWFLGTCASVGRQPHGARGAEEPALGEWYDNVRPNQLIHELAFRGFRDIWVQYEYDPAQPHGAGDLYWRAQRGAS